MENSFKACNLSVFHYFTNSPWPPLFRISPLPFWDAASQVVVKVYQETPVFASSQCYPAFGCFRKSFLRDERKKSWSPQMNLKS